MNRTHIASRYPDRTRARHCGLPARWRRPTHSPSRLSSAVFWGAQRPPESRVWACHPSFPVAFCTMMMNGGEQWEKNNGFVCLPVLLPINVRADASVSFRKVLASTRAPHGKAGRGRGLRANPKVHMSSSDIFHCCVLRKSQENVRLSNLILRQILT